MTDQEHADAVAATVEKLGDACREARDAGLLVHIDFDEDGVLMVTGRVLRITKLYPPDED